MGNSQCQYFQCNRNLQDCKCKTCENKQEVLIHNQAIINKDETKFSLKEKNLTPLPQKLGEVEEVLKENKDKNLKIFLESLNYGEIDFVNDDENDIFDKKLSISIDKLKFDSKKLKKENLLSRPSFELIEEIKKEPLTYRELNSNMLKNFDEESKKMLTSNHISGYIRKKESRNNIDHPNFKLNTQSFRSNLSKGNILKEEDYFKNEKLVVLNDLDSYELSKKDNKNIISKSLSKVFELNETEQDDKLPMNNSDSPRILGETKKIHDCIENDSQKFSRNKTNIFIKKSYIETKTCFKSHNPNNKKIQKAKNNIFSIIPEDKILNPVKDEVLYQGELLKYSAPPYKNSKTFSFHYQSFFAKFCIVTCEKI
jgi:hypothetical protein